RCKRLCANRDRYAVRRISLSAYGHIDRWLGQPIRVLLEVRRHLACESDLRHQRCPLLEEEISIDLEWLARLQASGAQIEIADDVSTLLLSILQYDRCVTHFEPGDRRQLRRALRCLVLGVRVTGVAAPQILPVAPPLLVGDESHPGADEPHVPDFDRAAK